MIYLIFFLIFLFGVSLFLLTQYFYKKFTNFHKFSFYIIYVVYDTNNQINLKNCIYNLENKKAYKFYMDIILEYLKKEHLGQQITILNIIELPKWSRTIKKNIA